MADFLVEALGFERGAVSSSQTDANMVLHGELWWPRGGGIMYATSGKDDTPFGTRVPGNEAVCLASDHPDGPYGRRRKAGADVIHEVEDAAYGSRTFGILDREGNRWSVGTYTGERRRESSHIPPRLNDEKPRGSPRTCVTRMVPCPRHDHCTPAIPASTTCPIPVRCGARGDDHIRQGDPQGQSAPPASGPPSEGPSACGSVAVSHRVTMGPSGPVSM